MSIPCESCTAPSDLYLCERCVTELRAALRSLALGPDVNGRPTTGLLDALNDVVTRQTRLGGGGGHRKRGDELPDLFEPHTADSELVNPDDVDGAWKKMTRQGQASDLLHEAQNKLGTIVRDVCETRVVDVLTAFRVVPDKGFVGPLLPGWKRVPCDWRPMLPEIANWLAVHVHSLACDEAAGAWKRDVDGLVGRIEKVIDRPPAPRFCGQCDTKIDRKICGLMLYARREAIEVTCPNPVCRTTHNIEALYNRWRNAIDYQIVSREEMIGNQRASNPELHNTGIMGALEEFVHWRTFQRWISDGHLRPVRYLRPNGRRGFFRHGPEDVPEYRVGDVRRVNRKMAQNNPVRKRVKGVSERGSKLV